jgi:hypothetical protein
MNDSRHANIVIALEALPELVPTWWLAPMFRERYPNLQLDESRMVRPP